VCRSERPGGLHHVADLTDLVKTELDRLAGTGMTASSGSTEMLTQGTYSEVLLQDLSDSLIMMGTRFKSIKQLAIRARDAKSMELMERWGGEEAYNRMRREHTNQRLKELLTNTMQVHKLIEWNNQLVRKVDPIYMEPVSRTGRAHFFAPHKRLGNLEIDTFWFNIMVIWVSAAILYVTLYYDLLRKFTNWQHIRRLRKRR